MYAKEQILDDQIADNFYFKHYYIKDRTKVDVQLAEWCKSSPSKHVLSRRGFESHGGQIIFTLRFFSKLV